MFEFLKRLSSSSRSFRNHAEDDDVMFVVDLPAIPNVPVQSNTPPMPRRSPTPVAELSPSNVVGSHRERLLAMKLDYLQICSSKRCGQLAAVGVQTAGDLVFGDPKKIASTFDNSQRAERAIRRYRTAIRMALAIESMMPRDALMLVSIHRRSVSSLARESAAQLHRDLERFSLSTRGSKLVGRRGVPSLRRVKAWVATCRGLAESATQESTQVAAA